MRRVQIMIVLVLVLLIGLILLQIWLSRRESRWPGLVLPGISLLISFLYPLNMMVPSEGVRMGFVVEMFLVWLLANIPTFVLLAIYFGAREKQRRKRQLDKMNIQDL